MDMFSRAPKFRYSGTFADFRKEKEYELYEMEERKRLSPELQESHYDISELQESHSDISEVSYGFGNFFSGSQENLLESEDNGDNLNIRMFIACYDGNRTILNKLLRQINSIPDVKMDELLITVAERWNATSKSGDYRGCFDDLLDHPKINVNKVDLYNFSALHYAVRNNNEEAIIKLLERGAYLGTKNEINKIPMAGINSQLLEQCFDKCIETDDQKQDDKNFEIKIDFKNLLPVNADKSDEMLPIKYIAESADLKHLLNHPLIASFLFLKWRKISVFFYIISLVYVLFCISLVLHILFHFNAAVNDTVQTVLKVVSIVGVACMIPRALIKLLMLRNYLSTYIEVVFVVLWIALLPDSNYKAEPLRTCAVATILLACVQVSMILGSLPFQGIATHVLMLEAVSKSFFWSFLQYSIFVVTFGLCFHIVFAKPENLSEEHNINEFNTPGISIFKAFVMLTGEFEAGSLNFSSPGSYWIFAIFVGFMGIVLLNLINGLAVGDTQTIRAQAKFNTNICLTEFLVNIDKWVAVLKHIPKLKKLTTSIEADYGKHIFIKTKDNQIVIYTTPQSTTPQPTTSQPTTSQPTTPQPTTSQPTVSKRILANFSSRLVSAFRCFEKELYTPTRDVVSSKPENAESLNWATKMREWLVDSIPESCFIMEIKFIEATLAVIEKKKQIQKQENISLEREKQLKKIESIILRHQDRLQRMETNIKRIPLRQKAEMEKLKLSVETNIKSIHVKQEIEMATLKLNMEKNIQSINLRQERMNSRLESIETNIKSIISLLKGYKTEAEV